jgi:S1-C subfamily serine protease
MSRRRVAFLTLAVVSIAQLAFSLGSWSVQRRLERQLAANEVRIQALRDETAVSILQARQAQTARPQGTEGWATTDVVPAGADSRGELVEEIKRQLQAEMGLLPVRLLRQRRESFVELDAFDNFGKSSYGTAGYLGNGYFITVKHAVVALDDRGGEPRSITSIKLHYQGKDLPAHVVDSGNADVEVHPGDWAIIKVRGSVDLPPLQIDTGYSYQFADPIVRFGNDYSKGIIVSTGYVGQRTVNGLVTCLTDGHPGVSGGGVLGQDGRLVGISVGRMQGDYRFSFILPLRAEMFRKVPSREASMLTN